MKLVKESLTAQSEGKLFILNNREKILQQCTVKLRNIFSDYLPWKGDEDDIEDCSNIWWNEIVDPGWEPIFITKYAKVPIYEDQDSIDEMDKIFDEALESLGLPREIIE